MGHSFTGLSFRKIQSKTFPQVSKSGKTTPFLEEQMCFCGYYEPWDCSYFPVCFDGWEAENQLTWKSCAQH